MATAAVAMPFNNNNTTNNNNIHNNKKKKRTMKRLHHRKTSTTTASTLSLNAEEHTRKIVMAWLARSFYMEPASSIAKGKVYKLYLQSEVSELPHVLARHSLGKLVHKVFYGVKTIRRGTKERAKYHYLNLQRWPSNRTSSSPPGITAMADTPFPCHPPFGLQIFQSLHNNTFYPSSSSTSSSSSSSSLQSLPSPPSSVSSSSPIALVPPPLRSPSPTPTATELLQQPLFFAEECEAYLVLQHPQQPQQHQQQEEDLDDIDRQVALFMYEYAPLLEARVLEVAEEEGMAEKSEGRDGEESGEETLREVKCKVEGEGEGEDVGVEGEEGQGGLYIEILQKVLQDREGSWSTVRGVFKKHWQPMFMSSDWPRCSGTSESFLKREADELRKMLSMAMMQKDRASPEGAALLRFLAKNLPVWSQDALKFFVNASLLANHGQLLEEFARAALKLAAQTN